MSMARTDDRVNRWLRQTASVERETSALISFSSVGNTNTSVSASRTDPFYIQVGVSGAWTGFGTISVLGLSPTSSPLLSTKTFSVNTLLRDTDNKFLSLSGITVSGFSGLGDVTIRAVSASGQIKEVLTVIKTIKCAVTRARFGQVLEPVGQVPINSAVIKMIPNNGVLLRDRLVVDGSRWEVKATRKLYDHLRMHIMDEAIVFAEDQT